MIKRVKILIMLFVGLLLTANVNAQMKDPTTWKVEAIRKFGNRFEVFFHVKLAPNWHIYALNPGGDGTLLPPVFTFDDNKSVKLIGTPKEASKPVEEVMEGIEGKVRFFSNEVTFVQEVEVSGNDPISASGNYEYQVCDDKICLPPKKQPFKVLIKP